MEKPIAIKYIDAIKEINPNFTGYITGNTEDQFVIDWKGEEEISVADIKAKITEMESAEAADKQAQIEDIQQDTEYSTSVDRNNIVIQPIIQDKS